MLSLALINIFIYSYEWCLACSLFTDDITSNTGNRTVANFKSPRIWHVVFADTFTCDSADITEQDPEKLNFLHYNMELLNPDALGNPREHFSDEETGKSFGSYSKCSKFSNTFLGAQWLSGRVLDLRPKGQGFEPHCVVSLSKTH